MVRPHVVPLMDTMADVHTPSQGQEHQINNRRHKPSVTGEVSRRLIREHTNFQTQGESLLNKLAGNPALPRMIGIPIIGVAVKVPTHVQQTGQGLDVVPNPTNRSRRRGVIINIEQMDLGSPKESKQRHITMVDNVCPEGRPQMRQSPVDIRDNTGPLRLQSPIDTRKWPAKQNKPVRVGGWSHNGGPLLRRGGHSLTNHPPGRFLDKQYVKMFREQFE